jgi:hypothetical protein
MHKSNSYKVKKGGASNGKARAAKSHPKEKEPVAMGNTHPPALEQEQQRSLFRGDTTP